MRTTPAVVLVAGLLAATLAACGSSASDTAAPGSTSAASPAACPTAPIGVVVSVDQWGDIVDSLAGSCAKVTTILKSSSLDPHDYDPTAADIAKFSDAALVVVNGVDYDPWAEKAAGNVDPEPVLVDAGTVTGVKEGGNPHLWYGPDYVSQVAAAVTEQLKTLSPDAADYFDDRATAWNTDMKPYFAVIADIKSAYAGKTFGATESVFDYMADAVGLKNVTPQGYQNAAANESDPAPGDVAAFDKVLTNDGANVLVYNTQTEGSIPKQIRKTATSADVPVVDVTETVAPGFDSFEGWQVAQLKELQKALGGQ